MAMMRPFLHAIAPRGPIDRIEDEVYVSRLAQGTERSISMECGLWGDGRSSRKGRRLMTRPIPDRYRLMLERLVVCCN